MGNPVECPETQNLVMWHIPGEWYKISLGGINRLMRWLLLVPPRPLVQLKLLYTAVLLLYLSFVLQWRFGFHYIVIYQKNDYFSRVIDLLNFSTLTIAHLVVAMELTWRNSRFHIDRQLERLRHLLRVNFGHKLRLKRIRRYCNAIYYLLGLCWTALLGMTLYININFDSSRLLLYSYYSEVILLLHLGEFSLYALLILTFYMELCEVGSRLIMELDKTRVEVWSIRRSSLQRLFALQSLHHLLWRTVRTIEKNFQLSLICVFVKYFVDITVLPYWVFVNIYNGTDAIANLHCCVEETCKLLFTFLPSLICTRCQFQHRLLRSILHGVTTDRTNAQLNAALYRISAQLGQEEFEFSAGGLMVINNETLGKYIFGLISYIIICIQFRVALIYNSPDTDVESVATEADTS